MLKNRVTFFSVCLILAISAFGQDDIETIQDFVQKSDDVFFSHVNAYSDLSKSLKKEIRDGLVTKDNLKLKKVGIVTTYLFEEKFNNNKALFQYVYSNGDDENYFFSKMASPLVEGVKLAFEESEIELLSPTQFLDSPDKQEAYQKLAKKLRTSDPFVQMIKDKKLEASGNEFEFIYTLSKEGESGKIADGLAEYAVELGFDAFLSIEINTKYMSKAVTFNGLQFTLHSVNPASKKGLLFNRYSLFADMFYPIAFVKGSKIESEAFSGFKELGERAAKDYLKFIDSTVEQAF